MKKIKMLNKKRLETITVDEQFKLFNKKTIGMKKDFAKVFFIEDTQVLCHKDIHKQHGFIIKIIFWSDMHDRLIELIKACDEDNSNWNELNESNKSLIGIVTKNK